MKKITSIKSKKILSSILIITLCIPMHVMKAQNSDNEYLKKVLTNLEQIKSATYIYYNWASAPKDTSAIDKFGGYMKEYSNPTDTFIGSCFAHFKLEDTTKMVYYYNGKAKYYLNWTEKTIRIDSFKNQRLAFRPISPPFFNYSRSIIKYALETKDSIATDFKNLGDSILFSLSIFDKTVEFFGKPFVSSDKGELSRYDIWINKSSDLPYRIERKMAHNESYRTCKNVKLNTTILDNFTSPKYIPSNFSLISERQKTNNYNLVGKIAPDWILNDVHKNKIALKELKSKILMIQFTSLNCGPCEVSIPFLKQLATEYNKKDFDFVSIESGTENSDVIKRHQEKNKLNYKFLISTKDIKSNYQINGFPVFFILDQNRMIKKIIMGYRKGKTEKEIRDTIAGLI